MLSSLYAVAEYFISTSGYYRIVQVLLFFLEKSFCLAYSVLRFIIPMERGGVPGRANLGGANSGEHIPTGEGIWAISTVRSDDLRIAYISAYISD
jgi:hypothetical protein